MRCPRCDLVFSVVHYGRMATDTKEIAERLRVEADYRRDYNGGDTISNMDIYADMPIYELFDKLADLIDQQSS